MTNPQVRFDHVTSVPAVIWPRVKHSDLGDAPYLPSFSLLLSGDAMLKVSEMYMLTKCTVVQK